MIIPGTEGLSPAQIRDLVARGGRFVAYEFCVSIVVMTFKNSSGVRFLRPRETGFLSNFLYSLLTVSLGWWGFPWGPIYSFMALATNLKGGLDVTEAVLQGLPDEGVPALPVPEDSFRPAESRKPSRFSPAPLAALGCLAALVFLVVAWVQQDHRRHMPTLLLNGTDKAYAVLLNGRSHQLAPHARLQLELPEGPVEVAAELPYLGSTYNYSLDTDAVPVSGDKMLVLNPDCSALVLQEFTQYVEAGSTPGPERPAVLHFGKAWHVLDKPHYVLSQFPNNIQMTKGVGRTEKTRLDAWTQGTLADRLRALSQMKGAKDVEAWFTALGALNPDWKELLELAPIHLKGAALDAFLEMHLKDLPVRLEWHRLYQNVHLVTGRGEALLEPYKLLAESDLHDGNLAYLYGRLLPNNAEAEAWLVRAVQAEKPSSIAWRALAFNDFSAGRLEGALTRLDEALAAGESADDMYSLSNDILLALGRAPELLARLKLMPVVKGTEATRASRELKLVYMISGAEVAQRVIDAFIATLPATQRAEQEPVLRNWLEGQLAYLKGDDKGFVASVKEDFPDWLRYNAAVVKGDFAEAAAVQGAQAPQTSAGWFLLYEAATLAGDARAKEYWGRALEVLSVEGIEGPKLRDMLEGRTPLDGGFIASLPQAGNQKRILLTACALRFPQKARDFTHLALKYNQDPEFPARLITKACQEARKSMSF